MSNFTLEWRGAETRKLVVAAVLDGLAEFGLRHETASKGELAPGRGVVTGTLRRSIHSSPPSYDFNSDHTKPSGGSPERGGSSPSLSEQGGRVMVVVGSGMQYARLIEDRYSYVRKGHERVIGDLLNVLEKHARAQGLTR